MATGGFDSGQQDRREGPTDNVSKNTSGANSVDGLKGKAYQESRLGDQLAVG